MPNGDVVWSDPFVLTVAHCPAAVALLDRDARYLMTSRRWISDLGIPTQDVIGRDHFEVLPQTSEAWRAAFRRCLTDGAQYVEEQRFVRHDGQVDWLCWELRAFRGASGEVAGVVVFADRTTERRRIQEELQRSEESLRLAMTGARIGTWQWNLRTGELSWSDVSYAIFGLAPGSGMSFERFLSHLHPDDRERVEATVLRSHETHSEYDIEFRVPWPDGSVHWVSTKGITYYDAFGRPQRMVGVAQDITPKKEAERALGESEERYRMLAEGMPHLLWQLDATGTLVYANHGWKRYFGREGIALFQWGEVIHPDELPGIVAVWPQMSVRETNLGPIRLRRHDGVYRWFTCRSVPVRDAAGQLLNIIGISTDVEDLVRTEAALRISQARLDTALRAAGMGTWVWEVDTDRMHWDRALVQLLGTGHDGSRTMAQLLSLAVAEDRPTIEAALARALRREAELEVEYRLRRSDGRVLWIAAKGQLEGDADGQPRRMFGACVDVTEHKRLEEELRQAQKMEAIGQLAGGVAHDFNNLLTVILGQVGIAELTDLPPSARRALQAVSDAAERAAALTAQLLAFGRRQPMNARDLVLDDLVLSVAGMLTRVLGERISLSFEPAATPCWIHADPNMVTQILMNLAINARDAMPKGGELVIRTSLERPPQGAAQDAVSGEASEYVCLSVRDSGQGISPEVLPHIFEPFFTTKEVGKGTGLGLATVYGIVRQHQGVVTVASEVDAGSVFKVYFPSVAARGSERPAAVTKPSHGRGELVLLVEDEEGVRSVVQTILEEHGYRLLVAADSQEALACWARHASQIDLLVTDVVMPNGLGGCELAATLQAQRPDLKIVLCSGYSAANVAQALEELERAVFVQKPYRADQLLHVIRQLLDAD